jgi:hypothetical protein
MALTTSNYPWKAAFYLHSAHATQLCGVRRHATNATTAMSQKTDPSAMAPAGKILERGRSWIEVWDAPSDAEARRAVEALVEPNATFHGADVDSATLHGPEEYLRYLQHMRAAFPDMQVRV